VTISLSPLPAAADHSNTRTPYPTPARSTAGEYDGFEYAGLPVNVCIFPIILSCNRIHGTLIDLGLRQRPADEPNFYRLRTLAANCFAIALAGREALQRYTFSRLSSLILRSGGLRT
jgi:hypothetical protein